MRHLLGVVGLLMCGCGQSYCEKTAAYFEDCGEFDASDADIDRCEAQVAPCSRSDKKLLSDSLDCSFDAGLFACETDSVEGDFEDFNAILACYTPLLDLSPKCTAAVSVITTTSSSTYR